MNIPCSMSFERQAVPCSMSCRPLFYVHTPRKTHTWRGLREPKRFKHCCYLNNNKNTAEKAAPSALRI